MSISPNLFFFFFNDTATTEIYTLSLHDALPISHGSRGDRKGVRLRNRGVRQETAREARGDGRAHRLLEPPRPVGGARGGARPRPAGQSRPYDPAPRHRPVQAGERHPRPRTEEHTTE